MKLFPAHSRTFPVISPGLIIIPAIMLFASCSAQIPRIDSVVPQIGRPGETITIHGNNFGAHRDESYVTIAGVSPTNSSYINWQNDHITMKTPELGDTGLIYVYVKGKKSNGALFSNQANLPKPPQGADFGIGPQIISITPQSAPVGSVITITGNNFGSSRDRSAVFFSWEGAPFLSAPPETRTAEFIEVSDTEFGYEFWSEREIRVRIPDGAVSGNMEVRTIRGESRPLFFDVSQRPGTKTFSEKRSYTINYSVNIKVDEASGANTLYLWLPLPVVSSAQRNIELLSRNTEPFVENFRGSNLYKMNNLASKSDVHINLSYKIDVYAIETTVRPQSIRPGTDSAVTVAYTRPDSLVPSDNPRVIARSNSIVAQERNPYLKAQRIYNWLINDCKFLTDEETGSPGSPVPPPETLGALETMRIDSYTAAILFCALGRAAGIPCIPVSGVLVNRNRQTYEHYWAEFWVENMGWIPVDPGLGARALPASFQRQAAAGEDSAAKYFFGNIDSHRIVFSRGQTNLTQMEQRGRVMGRTRSYSLQNLWEEAIGGLESYSSLWGDIIVTGIYAQ